MIITIRDGQLVTKDPSDVKVYKFDWDSENLGVGVSIATSTFTITAIAPSVVDTALTKDNEAVLSGDRSTQVRLLAGTLGQTYEIANKIRTNEVPYQEKERSFQLLIENK